ncbi:MAG: hypothetical protein JW772_03175 [Candidatus Diapherotrites archaeon]|nr:hypothetical protein [Candidatus Diapherotrites archaeon]
MNAPKEFWTAAIFGIVILSSAVLIGQANNLFGEAQAGNKITGTIVLSDKDTEKIFAGSVALPGTTCNVILMHCGTDVYVQGGGFADFYVPVLYKSNSVERNLSNRWIAGPLNSYVPISQPLGTPQGGGGATLDGCYGTEYRDLPAGNYIVGNGKVQYSYGMAEFLDVAATGNTAGYDLEMKNVVVSYVCNTS